MKGEGREAADTKVALIPVLTGLWAQKGNGGAGVGMEKSTGEARGEGSDRACWDAAVPMPQTVNSRKPGPSRPAPTSPRSPFRRLPPPPSSRAAARPDGTPAGPGECRHFRKAGQAGRWRSPERSRAAESCVEASIELAGVRCAGREPREKGLGKPADST